MLGAVGAAVERGRSGTENPCEDGCTSGAAGFLHDVFDVLFDRSAALTSAHSSLTAIGSTPVAAFPFSACVIFLLSSQARRFICISFSAGESSRIPGPTRCSTSSSRKSNETGRSSVNTVFSIFVSMVPPLKVRSPSKGLRVGHSTEGGAPPLVWVHLHKRNCASPPVLLVSPALRPPTDLVGS